MKNQKKQRYSILIIYYYFGEFPDWFQLFFETLKRNSTIDFLFYTDCDFSYLTATNVTFKKISFEDYSNFISKKLDIDFTPEKAYKLCDTAAFYGKIFENEIENYDFFGFADSDLFFGNIREFYNEEILKSYDVLSTHKNIVSGHFALFRNNKFNRELGFKIKGWKEKLMSQYCSGLAESFLAEVLFEEQKKINLSPFKLFKRPLNLYFEEQYTTPFISIPWLDGSINSNQPENWFYIDGNITNDRDKDRKFIYIHFMNFKTSKYRHDGTKAPWEGLNKICFAEAKDLKTGIKINSFGIIPVEN